jgi:hypothetical protein
MTAGKALAVAAESHPYHDWADTDAMISHLIAEHGMPPPDLAGLHAAHANPAGLHRIHDEAPHLRGDQEVRVLAIGVSGGYGQPGGGWPGQVVKVTAKQVHIRYGDAGRVDIFTRQGQRAACHDVGRRFATLPQLALESRARAAMNVLRGYEIRVQDPRAIPLEKLEAIAAALTRTWSPPREPSRG